MRRSSIAVSVFLLALVVGPVTNAATPPGNDDFANAVDFTGQTLPQTVSNLGNADATTETGEPTAPSCLGGDLVGTTVWYKYTPAADTSVSLDSFGSDFDTVIVAYVMPALGTLITDLVEIASACNDDSGPDFGSISRVAAILKSGVTYYFQVGGFQLSDQVVPPDSGIIDLAFAKRMAHPGVIRGNHWYLNGGFDTASELNFFYGKTTDFPLVGPIFGDGIAKPTVHRVNQWFGNFWFDPFQDGLPEQFGVFTDYPLLGDWNGDGYALPGVLRNGNHWFLEGENTIHDFFYGKPGDIPIVGDWDGNGTVTPGVIRGNTWFLNNNFDGTSDITAFGFGSATDFPVVGDWDGNGTDTPGVVRGNTWYLNNGFDPGSDVTPFGFGSVTDLPIAGDWGYAANPIA